MSRSQTGRAGRAGRTISFRLAAERHGLHLCARTRPLDPFQDDPITRLQAIAHSQLSPTVRSTLMTRGSTFSSAPTTITMALPA